LKAILEFSLPEERLEFDAAKNGLALKVAIREVDTQLRNDIKYAQHNEMFLLGIQFSRDILWKVVNDAGNGLLDD
jgi:hypothetical protein